MKNNTRNGRKPERPRQIFANSRSTEILPGASRLQELCIDSLAHKHQDDELQSRLKLELNITRHSEDSSRRSNYEDVLQNNKTIIKMYSYDFGKPGSSNRLNQTEHAKGNSTTESSLLNNSEDSDIIELSDSISSCNRCTRLGSMETSSEFMVSPCSDATASEPHSTTTANSFQFNLKKLCEQNPQLSHRERILEWEIYSDASEVEDYIGIPHEFNITSLELTRQQCRWRREQRSQSSSSKLNDSSIIKDSPGKVLFSIDTRTRSIQYSEKKKVKTSSNHASSTHKSCIENKTNLRQYRGARRVENNDNSDHRSKVDEEPKKEFCKYLGLKTKMQEGRSNCGAPVTVRRSARMRNGQNSASMDVKSETLCQNQSANSSSDERFNSNLKFIALDNFGGHNSKSMVNIFGNTSTPKHPFKNLRKPTPSRLFERAIRQNTEGNTQNLNCNESAIEHQNHLNGESKVPKQENSTNELKKSTFNMVKFTYLTSNDSDNSSEKSEKLLFSLCNPCIKQNMENQSFMQKENKVDDVSHGSQNVTSNYSRMKYLEYKYKINLTGNTLHISDHEKHPASDEKSILSHCGSLVRSTLNEDTLERTKIKVLPNVTEPKLLRRSTRKAKVNLKFRKESLEAEPLTKTENEADNSKQAETDITDAPIDYAKVPENSCDVEETECAQNLPLDNVCDMAPSNENDENDSIQSDKTSLVSESEGCEIDVLAKNESKGSDHQSKVVKTDIVQCKEKFRYKKKPVSMTIAKKNLNRGFVRFIRPSSANRSVFCDMKLLKIIDRGLKSAHSAKHRKKPPDVSSSEDMTTILSPAHKISMENEELHRKIDMSFPPDCKVDLGKKLRVNVEYIGIEKLKELGNSVGVMTSEACSSQVDHDVSASVKSLEATRKSSVFLANPLDPDNGVVLHAYYFLDQLVVVQEQKVSFWKYMRLIQMFGKSQQWEILGEIRRKIEDYEVVSPYKNRICVNESFPVYLEMKGRQFPDDPMRECNMAAVYVNVYFFDERKSSAVVHSVQLDTIKGFASDVIYTTISGSRYFIMCWRQQGIMNAVKTGICKYSLTPDLDTLASIREFKFMRHTVRQIECLDGERIIGFGETQVTIWNHRTGDVLTNIDLETTMGTNIGSILRFTADKQFLILYQNRQNSTNNTPELKVFAVNLGQTPYSFRLVYTHVLPMSFTTIVSSIGTEDFLFATARNGEELLLLPQQPHRLWFSQHSLSSKIVNKFHATGSPNFVEISNENLLIKTMYEYFLDFVK